jgi:hypothetical protein
VCLTTCSVAELLLRCTIQSALDWRNVLKNVDPIKIGECLGCVDIWCYLRSSASSGALIYTRNIC